MSRSLGWRETASQSRVYQSNMSESLSDDVSSTDSISISLDSAATMIRSPAASVESSSYSNHDTAESHSSTTTTTTTTDDSSDDSSDNDEHHRRHKHRHEHHHEHPHEHLQQIVAERSFGKQTGSFGFIDA
jgi:hypothetical protein